MLAWVLPRCRANFTVQSPVTHITRSVRIVQSYMIRLNCQMTLHVEQRVPHGFIEKRVE